MKLGNEEKRASFERKFYTGYAAVQIVIVNPTIKELATLFGTDEDKIKDPGYGKTEDKMRLDFWVKNHPSCKTEILTKFSIFLGKDEWLANEKLGSDGKPLPRKKQWIDKFSKTGWAVDKESLAQDQSTRDPIYRLDIASTRAARIGEEEIYSLMKSYSNVDPQNNPFILDDLKKIYQGNTKELREFFDHFNKQGEGIKIPLTIREAAYQSIFNKGIVYHKTPINKWVLKKFEGEYGCKDYFPGTELKEYNMEAQPENIEEESNTSDDTLPWGTGAEESKPEASPSSFTKEEQGVPYGKVEEDDLPF